MDCNSGANVCWALSGLLGRLLEPSDSVGDGSGIGRGNGGDDGGTADDCGGGGGGDGGARGFAEAHAVAGSAAADAASSSVLKSKKVAGLKLKLRAVGRAAIASRKFAAVRILYLLRVGSGG